MSELERRKADFIAEFKEIYKWSSEESVKVFRRRSAEGKPFDHELGDYDYIKKEVQRRTEELFSKYKDIPRDTPITLRDFTEGARQ